MNINDLLDEDSEFINSFKIGLEELGVEVDEAQLAVILQEYEMMKMEFLKNYILSTLEANGADLGELQEGPIKVVFSNGGVDFDANGTDDDDYTDSDLIS